MARANKQMLGEHREVSKIFHQGYVETLPGKVIFGFSLHSYVGNLKVKQKDIKMRKNTLKISHISPRHPSSAE